MASIATLAVQLVANTAPFTKGMQGATKSVEGLRKSTQMAENFVGGITARLGAAVSVGVVATAAFNKLRESFDAVEQLNDMSAALGASVQNLNALKMASSAAGGDFDKTTQAIGKMTKALGDDTASKAFKQIGLDPEALRGMDSVAAFETVARQINKLPTAFDRAKAMADIFGKSWMDMAEIVGGVDAIAQGREKLKQMGLEINEVDARMVDAANTAQRTFGAMVSAAFDKAAVSNSKFKNQFFENLNAIASTIPRTIELFGQLEKAINPVGAALRKMISDSAAKKLEETAKATDKLAESTKGLAEAQRQQQQVEENKKRGEQIYDDTRTPLENYKESIAELNTLLKECAISQDTYARASKQAMEKLNSQSSAALEKSPLVKGLKELQKLYKEGAEIADEVATPVEKVADKVNRAFELLNKGAIDGETFDRYIKKLQKDIMDSDKAPKDPRDTQSYQQTGSAGIAGYLRNVARGSQINGMRVSGPSSARTQVNDPQLKEAINYLKQITDNTADNTAVAA